VLRVVKGHYGVTDMQNTRDDGTVKHVAERTMDDVIIGYDITGDVQANTNRNLIYGAIRILY